MLINLLSRFRFPYYIYLCIYLSYESGRKIKSYVIWTYYLKLRTTVQSGERMTHPYILESKRSNQQSQSHSTKRKEEEIKIIIKKLFYSKGIPNKIPQLEREYPTCPQCLYHKAVLLTSTHTIHTFMSLNAFLSSLQKVLKFMLGSALRVCSISEFKHSVFSHIAFHLRNLSVLVCSSYFSC